MSKRINPRLTSVTLMQEKVYHFCVKSILVSSLALAGSAWAQSAYEESISGDLSDDANAPTLIPSSQTTITVGFTTDREGLDRDIFTIEVPTGFELSGVILDDYNSNYPENLGFVGFSSGAVLDADPILPTATGLLGWYLPDESNVGQDLFLEMGQAAGAIGYDEPLPSGFYTFWAQETSDSNDEWVLSVVLSPVDTTCVADVNGNGSVDFSDLVQLLSAFGPCASCVEDLDESGSVDFNDLDSMLSFWGPC